jgi:hypothetical protein
MRRALPFFDPPYRWEQARQTSQIGAQADMDNILELRNKISESGDSQTRKSTRYSVPTKPCLVERRAPGCRQFPVASHFCAAFPPVRCEKPRHSTPMLVFSMWSGHRHLQFAPHCSPSTAPVHRVQPSNDQPAHGAGRPGGWPGRGATFIRRREILANVARRAGIVVRVGVRACGSGAAACS